MKSPRKESQFAGAAAMFLQKEKEMLDQQSSPIPAPSPSSRSPPASTSKGKFRDFGNASMNNIAFSPKFDAGKKSSLKAPPFVSPGLANKPSWNKSTTSFPTSSYLDKPSGTPLRKSHSKVVETQNFAPLSLSPSPDPAAKQKVTAKSWRDNASISFQATSPGNFKRKAAKPEFNQFYGGSYLDDNTTASKRKNRSVELDPFPETPDIKIQVKIPDIEKKIKARQASKSQAIIQEKQQNIPEWKLKFQQREANRIRRENERQSDAAAKIWATYLGWKARAQFPTLLAANADRLKAMKEKDRILKLKFSSAIQIQKTWRGFLPRKRYLYVQECKKRREKNEKEIKRIEKLIAKIPKQTKAAIKDLKKEYAERKKTIKKNIKDDLKEDSKRLEAIQKSGHDMIEYMKGENLKLRQKQEAMKNEYKVLEKQFDLLTQKSDEIAQNFASLQAFVDKKNSSLRRNEINSQKCRHRYLPKYRAMLKDRDRHCIVEHRIAALYKQGLHSIVELLAVKCSNRGLVQEAQELLAECHKELEALPDVPIPDGLKDRIGTG